MRQITITELRKTPVKDIIAMLPFEVMADGEVMATVNKPGAPVKGRTKCPNCKMEYDIEVPDGKPFFFSTQPKRG